MTRMAFDRPDVLKCDFCATTNNLSWMEFTEPFLLPEEFDLPPYQDDGKWMACSDCHEHIEAGDVGRIVQVSTRAILNNVARHVQRDGSVDMDVTFTSRWQARIILAFFEYRTGSNQFG